MSTIGVKNKGTICKFLTSLYSQLVSKFIVKIHITYRWDTVVNKILVPCINYVLSTKDRGKNVKRMEVQKKRG